MEPEIELVEPLLGQGDGVVFDVGANKGDYTYAIQRVVAPGSIYSIEPLSAECRHLRRLFPAVTVLQLALSDHEGELELKVPIINGQPFPTRATLEKFQDLGETGVMLERTRLQTLDRLCVTMGLEKVRYIKIDVEGHEQKALVGASQTIKNWRPILQVEIEQRHHRDPISTIFGWVLDQGYSGFFYDAAQRRLHPLSEFNLGTHQALAAMGTPEYVNNFLFLNRDSAQRIVQAVHEKLASSQNSAFVRN
ncbi:MAG: FkbM family methyltransferase [Bryobacteraceae bacterium]